MENPIDSGTPNSSSKDSKNKKDENNKEKEKESNDENNNKSNNEGGEIIKTPEIGMSFKSFEEVFEYYKQYAWQVGFDVRVKRTTFTDTGQHYTVEFMCHRGGKGKVDPTYLSRPTAKTNCEAGLQLKLEIDGLLHLRKAILPHNHSLDPSLVKLMKRGRRRLSPAVRESTGDDTSNGGATEAKKRRKRYRWAPPDPVGTITELASVSTQEEGGGGGARVCIRAGLRLQEEDTSALYQFFKEMQCKDPNFFYMLDLDRDCRLRNVFWADAMSRASYKGFGDIVLLDTTYLFLDYDVPFAAFLGVNHHGQSVLLGCALISDNSVESYDWLFKTWLSCMNESPPRALITDQIESIRSAAARNFPATRHRFCVRQVMKRIPETLKKLDKYKEIKKGLMRLVYNLYKTDDFEQEWGKLIESYELGENSVLNLLYENRHEWVPVYLRNEFWAGISMMQQGPGITNFFEGYMYPDTSLKQFLGTYEAALSSRYEKSAQADVESSHKSPILVSKFYMEEQIAEAYTYNMFKEFQEELRGTMYCDILQVRESQSQIQSQPLSVFEIKESVFLEEGADLAEYRVMEVIYNPSDGIEVSCPCGLFQYKGILCRHALSVFKLQQIYDIPSRYIIDRWRKDYFFKQLYYSPGFSRNYVSAPAKSHRERCHSLAERCLRVSTLGIASEDRSNVLVKLMGEVERVLLTSGNFGKNTYFRLVQCESRGGENTGNFLVSDQERGVGSLAKKRGRPPKKRSDADVDTVGPTKKRTETIGTSFIENQCDVFLSAPTNLESNVDSQDNMILMGGVDPNVLSLGNQYGMQGNNRQYQSGDHSSRNLSNNMMQAQYDQQATGNPSRSQWIYQQMLQDGQMPTQHGQGGR